MKLFDELKEVYAKEQAVLSDRLTKLRQEIARCEGMLLKLAGGMEALDQAKEKVNGGGQSVANADAAGSAGATNQPDQNGTPSKPA